MTMLINPAVVRVPPAGEHVLRRIARRLFGMLYVGVVITLGLVPDLLIGEAPQPPAIYLHGGRDFNLSDDQYPYQGLLARELARQALLIAAREELSLPTRDVHLGQKLQAGDTSLDIVAIYGLDKPGAPATRLEILRGDPPRQQMFAAEEVTLDRPVELLPLIKQWEEHSRGRFVQHLRAAGLTGQARTWNHGAKMPEQADRLLLEMNFVTQFRAVCMLHAEIVQQGQSAELVAALSRAYANLSVLAELHWSPAHKVFAARSLLYAQRLMAQGREFTLSLTARAYAYALAGFHQAALEDLKALDQLAFQGRAEVSELAVIVRDYCRFRLELLDANRFSAEYSELVWLLRCLVKEQSGSALQTIEECLAARKVVPECYRIQTTLCRRAGVSLGHSVTLAGPAITARTLYKRVAAVPDLPAAARAIAHEMVWPPLPPDQLGLPGIDFAVEFPARAKMINEIRAAEGPRNGQCELDWQVFANLLADHSLQEVFSRAYFERRQLGVSCEDWLDTAQRLYEKHPLAALLDAYRDNPARSKRAGEEAGQIDLDTIELAADYLSDLTTSSIAAASNRRRDQTKTAGLMHLDRTASDLARRLGRESRDYQKRDAAAYYALSPHSPLARKFYIYYHWEQVKPEINTWMANAQNDGGQLATIAEKYVQDKQLDSAIELYRRACELSPDLSNYRALANAYRAQGKIDQWQATLESFLKQPDYGLQHAAVQQEIAHLYMSLHQWEKALPFAQGAADDSFASWALTTAGACHEALANWTKAEDIYRSESERYQTLQWYAFTRRTGQGDSQAAERFAKALLSGPQAARRSVWDHIAFALLSGDRARARSQLEKQFRQGRFAVNGIHAALLAHADKDEVARDALLGDVVDAARKSAAKGPHVGMFALAKALAQDLSAGGKDAFAPSALEALLTKTPHDQQPAVAYLAGYYLDLRGEKQMAERLWLRVMTRSGMLDWYRTLAGSQLIDRQIGPESYRRELLTPVDAPPDFEPGPAATDSPAP